MIHELTDSSGLGFCGAAVPGLVPRDYHGPLVVAFDSNMLIDLQDHGLALMNDDPLPAAVERDTAYAAELRSLADLLDLWLLRDIRFVVTPRARTDGENLGRPERAGRRLASIDAIADSLAFQLDDWSMTPLPMASLSDERGLPDGADRDLVLEAQAVGAHVFLTRDRRVLRRTELAGARLGVLAPSTLVNRLVQAGVGLFSGGTCDADPCPYYVPGGLPAPDMGKWSGLLSVLGE